MISDPRDSGTGTNYPAFNGDDTSPKSKSTGNTAIADYLISKIDQNLDSIRFDVQDIKNKITIDQRMIISDISIGVISSLIVSMIFLFVTTNIGITNITFLGMSIPIFILFIVSLGLVGIATYSITKRCLLRSQKEEK